ncbi:unnamed protein product [Withania somnifera]
MDTDRNWLEKVEDLVDGGEITEAISLIKKLITKLENESQNSSDCQQGVNATKEPNGDSRSQVSQNWEAIADRAPDELLSPQHLPEVSKISLQDSKVQGPKQRGRGTFSYQKHSLYSDQHTKTSDLEKLLQKFKDDVAIRWANDTTALAVFRPPSLALEASNSILCSFTVRVLCEEDELLSSIPPRDLEPPRIRPQTSARTAQRLIAKTMGIKLPNTGFGSREYRRQEEARKNRIVSRQNLKKDAWGDDGN